MKAILRFAGVFLLMVFVGRTAEAGDEATHGKAEHIVVVVWDGMRPDFITPEYTPTLYKLSQGGVFFKNNHSVYVSSTEVNGTAIATGVYPNRSHLFANREYLPEVDPLAPVAMEDEKTIRVEDEKGKLLGVPTLEETLQNAGDRTVIAGTKTVTLLPDRSINRVSEAAKKSVVFYAGKSIPESAIAEATATLGIPFPPTVTFPNRDADAWTTRALTEYLWKDEVPKFSLLWMSDPDFSQHNTAPGAPIALGALKSVDDNLATVLAALDAKGIRDKTDVFIVSDHGFSTVDKASDVANVLKAAGFAAGRKFTATPQPGDIMVISLGGSVLFYVHGHDAATTQKLVDFLQGSDFAGVIFTREKMEGTFTLEQARLNTPESPDVVVALRWDDSKSSYGVTGGLTMDGTKAGKGTHASLSKYDVHNTLVAAGPDFKPGMADELPTANVDVAPTILWILGVAPAEVMDGRVLFEAMTGRPLEKLATTENTITAEKNGGGIRWRQTLKFTQLGSHSYLDEGNGGQLGEVK
ncbi:MAG: alkaline phosphatase family protein [Chthoniobacteraceae bacterium]